MVDKTAIVTGGNRGIGLNITECLVRDGYRVVVGSTKASFERPVDEKSVRHVVVDVASRSDHAKLVDCALDWTNTLDLFVNNAGYSAWHAIENIDDHFLDRILAVNLKGAFWGCQAAAARLQRGGSIINISSLAGKRGSANNAAYVASKFGMNGLTQSLAKELGPKGIRVNALCPVLVKTTGLIEALAEPEAPGASGPDTFLSNFEAANSATLSLPTGDDVGNMCVFLASDAAKAITGQCINVDSGVFPQ